MKIEIEISMLKSFVVQIPCSQLLNYLKKNLKIYKIRFYLWKKIFGGNDLKGNKKETLSHIKLI